MKGIAVDDEDNYDVLMSYDDEDFLSVLGGDQEKLNEKKFLISKIKEIEDSLKRKEESLQRNLELIIQLYKELGKNIFDILALLFFFVFFYSAHNL
jgi:hypothetical protein